MPPHSFPHTAEMRLLGILAPAISLICEAAEFLQFVCPRLDDSLEPPMAPNLPKLPHLHKLQVLPSPHPRWRPGDHTACVCSALPIREARGWTTARHRAAGPSPGCLVTGWVRGKKSPSQGTQETKAELRLDPGLLPPSPPPARWPFRGFKRKQRLTGNRLSRHPRSLQVYIKAQELLGKSYNISSENPDFHLFFKNHKIWQAEAHISLISRGGGHARTGSLTTSWDGARALAPSPPIPQLGRLPGPGRNQTGGQHRWVEAGCLQRRGLRGTVRSGLGGEDRM